MSITSHQDDVVVRPFADWLHDQSAGKSHNELSEGLHDLIARVKDTGKKGKLIFTVNVELMKDSDRVLVISDEIKLALPEYPRQASIFYTDADGNPVRNDPDQLTFESLREVPIPGGLEHVDLRTGEVTPTRIKNGA